MAENIEALKIAAKSNKARVEELQAALATAEQDLNARIHGEARAHLLLDGTDTINHACLYVRIEHLIRTWRRKIRAANTYRYRAVEARDLALHGKHVAEAALAAAVERAEQYKRVAFRALWHYGEAQRLIRAAEWSSAMEVRALAQMDTERERAEAAIGRARDAEAREESADILYNAERTKREAAEQEAEALRGDVNALIEKLHRHWDGMYGRSMDELDTPAAIDTLTPARKKAADLAMRATYELMHQLDGTENDYVKEAADDHA